MRPLPNPPAVPEGLHAVYEHFRCPLLPFATLHSEAMDEMPDAMPMDVLREQGFRLNPRGGRTTCTLLDDDGDVVAVGHAWCHTDWLTASRMEFRHGDQFSYAKGRLISLGRALKAWRSGTRP